VTPGPGGEIAIARDVIVVGNGAAYSPDGSHFAFTALRADGATGPDVYVWDSSTTTARPVTTDHGSVFSGWLDGGLLVSRLVAGSPRTVLLDPVSGIDQGGNPVAAWRPTVAPGGTSAAWWDGKVVLASDGVSLVPGAGRLVLGAWPIGKAGEQVLAEGPLADWQVRWDETGSFLAVWIAGSTPGAPGRLSLYPVDPLTGRASLAKPILSDEPALDGFSLRDGRLAWTAPKAGGGTTVQVYAWRGDTVGRLELPAEVGTTVLH
jgi:hypothetical protein